MSQKEYAVIFKTKRQLPMPEEYTLLSKKLLEMAQGLPGFLTIESVADAQGNGISVSYWASLEAIQSWKEVPVHLDAQSEGKKRWYEDYSVEICEVIRSYKK